MENIIEPYIGQFRTLVEETAVKFSFDDDLKLFKEKFAEDIGESNQKLANNLFAPSGLTKEESERINKIANDKLLNCIKEINQHIDWAIEQRNLIEQNARYQLVNNFLVSTDSFFDHDLKACLSKLGLQESGREERSMEQIKITDAFLQELKKHTEPARNLFRKEIQNFIKELRTMDCQFKDLKINTLIKKSRSFEMDSDTEYNTVQNRSTRTTFTVLFDLINKSMQTLLSDLNNCDKEINDILESSLIKQLDSIKEKYYEFEESYLNALNTEFERKNENEINSHAEISKQKIKTVLNELTSDFAVKGTFSFTNLTTKLLTNKIDFDLEQELFKLYVQLLNHDLQNGFAFETAYVDLRYELDRNLNQLSSQAIKYPRFDQAKDTSTDNLLKTIYSTVKPHPLDR